MVKDSCSVSECIEPVHSRYLCSVHYRRFARSGTVELLGKLCKVPECMERRPPGRAFSYCLFHAAEKRTESNRRGQATYKEKHPEAVINAQMLNRNGITWERYGEMLAAQDGKCAVCRTDKPGGTGRWHIDHNHVCCPGRRSCGKCIRGLLCSTCNGYLIAALESPHLANAMTYLASYQ